MVEVGETETLLPLRLPGIQLYVEAPLVLSVEEEPSQIVAEEDDAVTVGSGLIVTLTKSVLPEQANVVFVTCTW